MRVVRVTLRAGLAGLAVLAPGPLGAQTANPDNPHGVLPAGLDCGACHVAVVWSALRKPIAYDHRNAGFPLDGRHGATACVGCHLDLRFDGPDIGPTQCSSCHLDVHQGSLTGGCMSCHNTTSFQEAGTLDQHARTRFPMDGAHIRLSCVQCHRQDAGGIFTPIAPECLACHEADYPRGHADLGSGTVDTRCEFCHRTSSWSGATFNHATTGIALAGAHATAPCAACHNPADNSLLFRTPANDQDCVACHQADYDAAHTGSAFPTTCASCHGPSTWLGATFNHSSFFPTVSGKHAGKWQTCQQCHPVQGDYSVFTCMSAGCHSQAGTDRDHSNVSGYAFDPLKCLACHPTGD